jgi:hypothetical protein
MFDSDYASLTDIGTMFGVTSHVLGRWLSSELGLRTIGRSPTAKAFEQGLVKRVPTGRGSDDGYYYVWHVSKVVALLEAAGHKRVQQPEPPPAAPTANLFVGPFAYRANGGDGFEITNGDGNVFAWVRGERVAAFLVKLLTLLDERGKLPRPA